MKSGRMVSSLTANITRPPDRGANVKRLRAIRAKSTTFAVFMMSATPQCKQLSLQKGSSSSRIGILAGARALKTVQANRLTRSITWSALGS